MISGSHGQHLALTNFDRQNEPGVDPFLIEVIVSGSVAEHGHKFLKGRPLPLDGYLSYRIWKERNSGQQRRTHAVLARSVKCLARLGVVIRADLQASDNSDVWRDPIPYRYPFDTPFTPLDTRSSLATIPIFSPWAIPGYRSNVLGILPNLPMTGAAAADSPESHQSAAVFSLIQNSGRYHVPLLNAFQL